MRLFIVAALWTATFLAHSARVAAAEPIRVLIIDGQNNHNWKSTTPILQKHLEDSGRFTVSVATAPGKGKADAMAAFAPDLSKVDVVVSNYNGESWSKTFNTALESQVKAGKLGYVVIHAANNAFGNWSEYYQMIGMGWQGPKFGRRLYLDDQGQEQFQKSGEGDGAGHRYVGPFRVTIRDTEHPITKGMPAEWLHVQDELYDNMRGPIENVKLLATAYSDKAKKGTGRHEPMIWTVSYGTGRVFHTPMGHDATAMSCVGFATTLTRGTEWAATGRVTLAVPKNFPTADKTSTMPAK
jgi:uncharacterized protein